MIRLFEGMDAQQTALSEALLYGPLFYPEMGEGGLKKDDARQIVEWMYTPLGMDVCIVLGPMDDIRQGSADALLKVIEEPPCPSIHLHLWCLDSAQVSPTILSRVPPEFVGGIPPEEDFEEVSRMFLEQDAEFFGVLKEWKGKESLLLRGILSALDPEDLSHLRKWEQMKPLLSLPLTTPSMLVASWFD